MPLDLSDPKSVDQFTANARAHGYTQDQINGYVGQRVDQFRQNAIGQGYTQEQVDHYLGSKFPGYQDVRPIISGLQQNAQENLNANPGVQQHVVTDPIGAFGAGLQASSGGLMARGKLPDTVVPEHVGMFTRLAREAGEMTGDIPAMFAGALAGGSAGTAAGGGAGAAVPVAGETGVSEVAGGVTGAVVGGGAGMNALPTFIKQAYIDGLKNGSWKSPEDFAVRTAGILWDTTKAGMVGAATAAVGGKVGVAVGKAGLALNPWAGLAVKTGAELTTMTTGAAALNGKLPTREDFLDGAALLAAFHVVGSGSRLPAKLVTNARDNLADHWAATEQHPVAAAHDAVNDPQQRTKMLNTPEPVVHPLSPQKATDSGVFVAQHIPSAFDDDVKFVIDKQEGGGRLNTDTGGATKWGISAKNHPGLDIKNLTQEQAQQIYHENYWKPIGADNIADPKLRRAAFDSAVNEGVGPTKEWLKQAGGDLQTFLALRAQKYRTLLENQPEKYGQYEASWNARLERLGATSTIRGMKLPEGVGEAGGPPMPPAEPPASPAEPEEPSDAFGRVKATMGDFDEPKEDKGDFWGGIRDKAESMYREIFNPEHPIWKMTDALLGRGDLPDMENPRIQARMAELAPNLGRYMIERNMIDTEGNVTGKGLKDVVGDLKGKDLDDFLVYARARWGQDQVAQGKVTPNEAADYNKVVEAGQEKHEGRYQDLVGWRNGTLKYLHDAGILSPEAYEKALAEGAGIPGYRIPEEGEAGGASSGGGKGREAYNPLKRSTGSDLRTQGIMGNLLKEAFMRTELGRRNMMNLSIADAADALGIGRKVDASRLVKVNVTDAELMKAMDEEGSLGTDGEGLNVYRRLGANLKDNQVPIFRDGKMEVWEFDDPEIARYIRGFDKQSMGTLTKVVAAMTRFTRASIVHSPDFPVRNLLYDMPWQFISKPGFRNTLTGAFMGIRGLLTDPEGFDTWIRSGGAEGVFGHYAKDQYIKDVLNGGGDPDFTGGAWNKIHTPWDGLRAWGQMLSMAPRFGRFLQGQQEGESLQRSGAASTDAAFHRAGYGSSWARNVNSVIPFFTAHLNSLEQTIRSQFGVGRTITGEKFDAKQFSAKAAALITMPVIASWLMNKDKEWYKAAPDWQKDNGLLFHIGPDNGGHTLFLAFPPLVSFMYGGMPRRMLEAFGHDNPHALDGAAGSFGMSLMPPGVLNGIGIMSPVVEHIANHSFFKDRPLVPDDVKRSAMAPEQFNQYSSDTAKAMSRFFSDLPLIKDMKLSPPVIDNYIQGWGGTLGRDAVRFAEQAYHQSVAHDKPAATLEDWPLLSSWLSRYPSASAQPIQDFRRRMDDFNSVHGSMVKLIESGQLDRFKELAAANPTAATIHAYKMRNEPTPSNVQDYASVLDQAGQSANKDAAQTIIGAEKAIQRLNTSIKFIYANESMTPRDKRQQIDQAYGQMQVISEQGNKALDAMEQSKPVPKLNLPDLAASLPTPQRNAPRQSAPAAPPPPQTGQVPVA